MSACKWRCGQHISTLSCAFKNRRVVHVVGPATNARLVLHCDAEELPPTQPMHASDDLRDDGEDDEELADEKHVADQSQADAEQHSDSSSE